jgi:hypothetical protein
MTDQPMTGHVRAEISVEVTHPPVESMTLAERAHLGIEGDGSNG